MQNNMHPTDLSIVIVSWNTREILRACLKSVETAIQQEQLNVEVIVVDNHSQDGTLAMLEADFDWVHLIKNNSNRGFAAANNQAFDCATGRYTLLLNSDTLIHDRVLTNSFNYMEAHPKVGLMGCRVLNADGSHQVSHSRFPSFAQLLIQTTGRQRSKPAVEEQAVQVISGCFMLARRSAAASVGQLDASFFFFGEEVDWCRRFSSHGWKIRFAPVGSITHLGGASANQLGSHRDLLLTAAFVRLHRKHSGVFSAATVWILLLLFNASRCLLWLAAGITHFKPRLHPRAKHFAGVLRDFRKVWSMAV